MKHFARKIVITNGDATDFFKLIFKLEQLGGSLFLVENLLIETKNQLHKFKEQLPDPRSKENDIWAKKRRIENRLKISKIRNEIKILSAKAKRYQKRSESIKKEILFCLMRNFKRKK